ncbi:hypothetical protein PVAND_015455 [Polypedilum vanderplanki]|uniref:ABC transporter domain-containing protein n=1 Tax=Polypedilum vanderplanki TaxID=319348 RepID=A0A9J6BD62_POLVA|nr:hypothetical protein PVAND_015455 [Polypedilum vanderplanki]
MTEHISLRFANVSCHVHTISFRHRLKKILKNVSGNFNGGELTAIVGPSGSGKSTLLDCLSGFRRTNVSGKFIVDGNEISIDDIRQMSSYVMQDQSLHIHLTVREIMALSLNLRDKQNLSDAAKKNKIFNVFETLGIERKCETVMTELSGGERKRVQIAIELVNDPKILFVDEATTGLDCVASTRCIEYLKKLALEGRTIICTIHQPSASILKLFDQIYAIANGSCIYQGSSTKLLEFLNDIELPCPSTYNPIDFLLEIANDCYGEQSEKLIQKIENGKNFDYCNVKEKYENFILSEVNYHQSSSYSKQVYYLLKRTFLTTSRDMTIFTFRYFFHLILGLTFGLMYHDMGNRGEYMLNNYKYLVLSVVILVYTSYYSIYFQFLHEFSIVKREYFNGWYSTEAYYTALILFDVPMTLICCTTYVSITYWLTNQPAEFYRYILFLSFIILMSFASQSLGVMFSSVLDIKTATTFSFMFLLPFIVLSGILIVTSHTPEFFKFFFDFNFLDSTLKGVLNSVLGLGRRKAECDDLYCHLVEPGKLLSDFGAVIDISRAFKVILIYIVICQIISYLIIRYRLRK